MKNQNKDMRTPLSRVRGLGASRGGTHHFWLQRITALANIPLTLFFVFVMASHLYAPHAQVAAFIAQPFVAVPLLLLVISLCWHMRLGLQVVIDDYLITPKLKWAALIFNQFFAISVAVVASLSLIKLVVA